MRDPRDLTRDVEKGLKQPAARTHPYFLVTGGLLAALLAAILSAAGGSGTATGSAAIPLSPNTWMPIGPAPTVNGSTDYFDDASGRVTALAAHPTDPNTIYIGAAGGGVWKTTDGGTNWAPLTDTVSTLFMGAIALAPSNPDVIYAGTGEANMGPSKARNFRDNIYYGRGVLKSTDAGATWTLLGSAEFDRRTISKIVVDPTDPNMVYVAVGALATNGLPGNTGIWKSTDGGVTWTNTTPGISESAAFSDLVMHSSDPQVLYAAVGAPAGDPANGVYKTTDRGASWSVAGDFPIGNTQLGRIKLAISQTDPQKLFVSIARPGPPHSTTNSLYRIMRTSDGGTTWVSLGASVPGTICPAEGGLVNYMASSGDYHTTLTIDPSNADIVYAGGICLIRTADGGSTWSAIAPGTNCGPHRDHQAIGFDANGKLLDGNDGGVWRMESAEPVTCPDPPGWTNLNGNLQITQFVGIALHPTDVDIAYGGTQDTGSMKFEANPRWRRHLRGDGGASAVSASNPNTVYQVTRIAVSSPNIFRRSINGGATWLVRVTGINPDDPKNFYPPVVMDASNSDRLLLGTNGVYETTNRADNWSPISTPGQNGWTVNDNIDALAPAPSDVNTIYATAGGHIFVTFDRGVTWHQRDIAGIVDHFADLLVDPANNLVAYAVRDRFGGGHVFRTANGGENWSDISGDLPDLPTYTVELDPRTAPNTLYVGTDAGVLSSADLGASWVAFGTDLPNAQVNDLKLNTTLNVLAAGTHGRGVWRILIP